MEKEWNKIKEKAGVNDFRFHDLRHTVGTRLAQKGVPVPVINNAFFQFPQLNTEESKTPNGINNKIFSKICFA